VSDQQPQPTSGETGALGAGPTAPDMPAPSEPVTAAAEIEAARLAPEQEETAPKPDAPKVEAVKMEDPKVEASRAEAPKIDAPKVDAVKPEAPRFPGNVTIMSPGDRGGADAKAAPAEGPFGKRRIGAMAAVVALATVAGALGGALATAGIGKLMAGDSAQVPAKDSALEATVARLDADIVALKASLEHTAKAGTTQLNKANDRLDKVEKAQAEPAAKLAKLSETVDKLRAAQASATTAAAAPAPAKEVTGTIPQQQQAAAACGSAQARGCPAADRRRLGIARRRQWQRPDRGPPRHVRGLCRRSNPRSRPCRRHSQAGRPLGGRDQQGPDRRALTGRYANRKALHGDVRRLSS
jgi:hypothetical protein